MCSSLKTSRAWEKSLRSFASGNLPFTWSLYLTAPAYLSQARAWTGCPKPPASHRGMAIELKVQDSPANLPFSFNDIDEEVDTSSDSSPGDCQYQASMTLPANVYSSPASFRA